MQPFLHSASTGLSPALCPSLYSYPNLDPSLYTPLYPIVYPLLCANARALTPCWVPSPELSFTPESLSELWLPWHLVVVRRAAVRRSHCCVDRRAANRPGGNRLGGNHPPTQRCCDDRSSAFCCYVKHPHLSLLRLARPQKRFAPARVDASPKNFLHLWHLPPWIRGR
jgi:hypothetical protein